MTGRVLTIDPTDPASRQTVVLDGVSYILEFTWRERPASWYADLYAADGTAIALGRRLSPGTSLLSGRVLEGAPPGSIFVRGPDPYLRGDLGGALRVIYYPEAELPEAEEEDPPRLALL